VARESALGVVPLRRRAGCGAGLERIGGGIETGKVLMNF